MTLSPGTRLGPYEITAPLGAGGMGEVYRAQDLKLGRDVAIKVLPEAFAGEPERVARFTREARTLAALNHPNIAQLHGIEDSGGVHALVMELVEGPTLADRIRQGAIPLAEALHIARQMAEALEAAHEAGIIHRDLKPANVKVRDDGTVKVLDFGLAKATESVGTSNAELTNSPTITSPAAMTARGVILGTAGYMAPEQARGSMADKRADLWAFGAVLYEMLTGQQAFQGATVSDTLAAVLKTEPDWTALPAETPLPIRRLLRRCLQKDRRERLHDVSDARLEIADALTTPELDAADAVPGVARPWWQRPVTLGLIAVGLVGLTALGVWRLAGRTGSVPPVLRVSVELPDGVALNGSKPLELSPDGTRIAVAGIEKGEARLYLRAVDAFEARPVPGTEGATGPFFSPDGRWLGFFAEGQLRKVSLESGTVLPICDTSGEQPGAAWGPDGTIVFTRRRTGILYRVSADGGTPAVLATPDRSDGEGGFGFLWPQFLPDGRTVLFTVAGRGLATMSLDSGRWQPVEGFGFFRQAYLGDQAGRYLDTGHLVFSLGTELLAVRFDLSTRRAAGEAVRLAEDLAPAASGATGPILLFAASDTGLVAYVPPREDPSWRLVAVDRHGVVEALATDVGLFREPRLSPDGRRLAWWAQGDIWVYDLEQRTKTRVTMDPAMDTSPAWTPDGAHLIFSSLRAGDMDLYRVRADGVGGAERLLDRAHEQHASAVTQDGAIVFVDLPPETGGDVWMLRESREPEPLVTGPADEWGRVSPDGRLLAYSSNESGRRQIFVRTVEDGGPRPSAPVEGLDEEDGLDVCRWSRDSARLFVQQGGRVLALTVIREPTLGFGAPETLVDMASALTGDLAGFRVVPGPVWGGFDVFPDGERVVAVVAPPLAAQATVRVISNVGAALRASAPAER